MNRIALSLLVFAGTALAVSAASYLPKADYKRHYAQEYTPGENGCRGDVDIAAFLAVDPAFEIGADADGYAVFKDPDGAFDALCEQYADALARIRKRYCLPPLTRSDFEAYRAYAPRTAGTAAEQERTGFVARFLDVYANSFRA